MKITKTKIYIGVERPFKVLHISDLHLALSDERDVPEKNAFTDRRSREFGVPHHENLEYLNEYVRYAKENGELLLITGDICDCVSYQNWETVRDLLDGTEYLYVSGNHDFVTHFYDPFDETYDTMDRQAFVQSYVKNNIFMASKLWHGVNFVSIYNANLRFTSQQYAFLKSEADKSHPIILCVHIPFYEKTLHKTVLERRQSPYLFNIPDFEVDSQHKHFTGDEITKEMQEYIFTNPQIKAVLAGHIHFETDTRISANQMQYVAEEGSHNCAREFEIV